MGTLAGILRDRDTTRSAGRYFVVGAMGTTLDVGLYMVLHLVLHVPDLAANTLAYSAGIINNFFFHRYWTFSDRPRKAALAQFGQFLAVSLTALAVNNLLVLALALPIGSLFVSEAVGDVATKAAATAASMVWNFIANHLWTFARLPSGPGAPRAME